jgi:hypothetical protein
MRENSMTESNMPFLQIFGSGVFPYRLLQPDELRLSQICHCEEQSDEAIRSVVFGPGLLREACHPAALRADRVARNDEADTELT